MSAVTQIIGKNENCEDNYEQLVYEVIRGSIKSEGTSYLLTKSGQCWINSLGIEPSELYKLIRRKMKGSFHTESRRLSNFGKPCVYKSDKPKNCEKCGSSALKPSSEEYGGIIDTFWVCDCGWEDAESTFAVETAIKNREAYAA
jgi:hypothetical protein